VIAATSIAGTRSEPLVGTARSARTRRNNIVRHAAGLAPHYVRVNAIAPERRLVNNAGGCTASRTRRAEVRRWFRSGGSAGPTRSRTCAAARLAGSFFTSLVVAVGGGATAKRPGR
jgi:hypothetical protein